MPSILIFILDPLELFKVGSRRGLLDRFRGKGWWIWGWTDGKLVDREEGVNRCGVGIGDLEVIGR